MSNTWGVAFSQENPGNYPSLAPTFIHFYNMETGTTLAPPTITQLAATGIYQFDYTPSFATYFLLDGITTEAATERYVYGILDPSGVVDIQLAESISLLTGYQSTLSALGTTNVALGTTAVELGNLNQQANSTLTALGVTSVGYGETNLAYNTSIYAASITLTAIGVSHSALSSSLMALIGTTMSSIGTTSVDPSDLFGYLKRLQEFNEGNATFNKVSGVWDIQTRGSTTFASKTLGNTSTEVSKS